MHGKKVRIDRFFPCMNMCSCCHLILDDLPFSVPPWAYPGCGTLHDRDLNVATNLFADGTP